MTPLIVALLLVSNSSAPKRLESLSCGRTAMFNGAAQIAVTEIPKQIEARSSANVVYCDQAACLPVFSVPRGRPFKLQWSSGTKTVVVSADYTEAGVVVGPLGQSPRLPTFSFQPLSAYSAGAGADLYAYPPPEPCVSVPPISTTTR